MEHQTHLDKKPTIHFRSFYTPHHIAQIIFCMLSNASKKCQDNIWLDNACGYGNFLQLQAFKRNIGIDEQTLTHVVNYLQEYQDKLAQSPLLLRANALYYICKDNFEYRKIDYHEQSTL